MADVSGTPIRVILVDDDPLVRSALALILGGDPGIDVVAQAGDGAAGVDAVEEHRPDVVLMDIRMPVLDGLGATEQILALAQPPQVIVLTTFDADDYVLRALGAGASGFLLKDTPPAEIVSAVRRVADGEPMLSPSVTTTLIARATAGSGSVPEDDHAVDARRRLALLTERELDVARAVGRGLNNTQIAHELFVSVPTVKAHIGRLFAKLGVENRVQIALLVQDAGRDPDGA